MGHLHSFRSDERFEFIKECYANPPKIYNHLCEIETQDEEYKEYYKEDRKEYNEIVKKSWKEYIKYYSAKQNNGEPPSPLLTNSSPEARH